MRLAGGVQREKENSGRGGEEIKAAGNNCRNGDVQPSFLFNFLTDRP